MTKTADRHPETFVDYRMWLDQDQVWPRQLTSDEEGVIDETPIAEMNPAYALNSYRKLERWCTDHQRISWPNTRRSVLAHALLERATGAPMAYRFEVQSLEGALDARTRQCDHVLRQLEDAKAQLRQTKAVADELGEQVETMRADPLSKALAAAGVTIIINTRGAGHDDD